jgi:hypothetical protein
MGTPTAPGTWAPQGTAMAGSGVPVVSKEELSGVSRIKWGALLGILGLVLAIGGVLIVLIEVGVGITNTTDSGYVSLLHTILLAIVLIVIGVIVALLSFVLYTAGFVALRKADGRFTTPMVLCVIALIGLALISGFVVSYALAIDSAIACPSANTTCQNNATSVAHGVVVLGYVGGFLGFIGLIGLIVGLWRFGSRYSSSITKVGAIFYIIPFLSILAPILVFIGAMMVHKKLRQPGVGSSGIQTTISTPPPS